MLSVGAVSIKVLVLSSPGMDSISGVVQGGRDGPTLWAASPGAHSGY